MSSPKSDSMMREIKEEIRQEKLREKREELKKWSYGRKSN